MSPRGVEKNLPPAPSLLDAEVLTPAPLPVAGDTHAGDLVHRRPAAVERPAATPAATPMMLLQIAMDQGADLDRLERLMQMQERWEQNEARKAFTMALAAFKANPPAITKNKTVDFQTAKGRTTYEHATLDEVALKIGAALAPHGLSFRWNVEQKAPRVFVTCILQHQLGHSESVTMDGPADDSGNKNQIQQVGSTVTYLERYTLLAITGMAVQGQDDDGHGATKKPADQGAQMPEADYQKHRAAILGAKTLEDLQKAFGVAFNACGRDLQTRNTFTQLKDQRKAEMRGGAQ